ncbi:hypothetical protein, partial [Paraburkholderia dipogonis]|uniref:hypothetical protein n=1 Tax=Paraburkholderia dipogonis TaxID=1211383 RepID=UPI0038B73EBF
TSRPRAAGRSRFIRCAVCARLLGFYQRIASAFMQGAQRPWSSWEQNSYSLSAVVSRVDGDRYLLFQCGIGEREMARSATFHDDLTQVTLSGLSPNSILAAGINSIVFLNMT